MLLAHVSALTKVRMIILWTRKTYEKNLVAMHVKIKSAVCEVNNEQTLTHVRNILPGGPNGNFSYKATRSVTRILQ